MGAQKINEIIFERLLYRETGAKEGMEMGKEEKLSLERDLLNKRPRMETQSHNKHG